MKTRDKIRADLIVRQLQKRHKSDTFLTQVKNGPTYFSNNLQVMDAVAFAKSWAHPCITGYEVKVDRQDFLRDTKWPSYMQDCHVFYFACPVGLIMPEELPNEVGLIWYNPEKDCIHTKRKALFRNIELPTLLLYYAVICRMDSDRHPFFSGRREFFEALVRDKEERRNLKYKVSRRISDLISEQENKIRELESRLRSAEQAIKEAQRLKDVLAEFGIDTKRYYWEEHFKTQLQKGMPANILNNLQIAADAIQRVLSAVEMAEKREEVRA